MSEGNWLNITEYSNYKDISISTVRRYIKANRVKHKMLDGKYLIFVAEEKLRPKNELSEKENIKLKLDVQRLAEKVKKLEEENNDLKMLIQIYESEKQAQRKVEINKLPEIPFN